MYVHDTLLLSCGSADDRSALRGIFEDSFNLLEADNTHQTLMLLRQNHPCIAALLIDQTVFEKIDPAVLSDIETLSASEEIPMIVFVNADSKFSAVLAYEHGAVDVISKPFDPPGLHFRIQNIVNLYRHKWHLEEKIEEQTQLLRHFNDSIVDALASIIEHRSAESGRHILRIRRFTQILLEELARSCPEYKLDKKHINIISSASALHDVGKISIPDSILNKPGRLTAEEWSVMKNHTLTGCQILETFHDIVNQDYLRYAHNICHYHHERWDGTGYPEGIAGDDIPICAQAVSLADVYDALTTSRPYKDAYSFDQAVNMILHGECGTFSPRILECFKAVIRKFEETARSYADGLSPKAENFDVTLPVPTPDSQQSSLQRLQHKYQTLLHHVNAAAIEVDLERNFFHMVYNPYPELVSLGTGNTLSELVDILYRTIFPQDRNKLTTLLRTDIPRLLDFDVHRLTSRLRTPTPSSRYPDLYQVTILNSSTDDAHKRLLVLCQKENPFSQPVPAHRPPEDISEEIRGDVPLATEAQTQQFLTLEQYQTILNQKNNILFAWDLPNDHITFSDQWKTIFGYPPITEDLMRQLSLSSHFHPEDIPVLRQHIRSLKNGSSYQAMEARIAKSDGRYLWCRIQATSARDKTGQTNRIVGTIINIDAEKRAVQTLLEQAERDALTKLLNKNAARRLAEEYLASSGSADCAFLIIDLDNFKHINDRYGHLFGDAVLSQTAKEIKKLFRSQDIIARIGGDEFLVVMRGISDGELAAHRCRRLLTALQSQFRRHLADDPLSASIGVALSPCHGTSYQELFQRADQALYQAKDAGKNAFRVYDIAETDQYLKRRENVTALNARIDSDVQPGLANHNIVQHLFQLLQQNNDPESAIHALMKAIGEQTGVSRVYVFENSSDNMRCSNTFEWCSNDASPQIHTLQNLNYRRDLPDFEQHFDENGVFYCPDTKEAPQFLRRILEQQNIRSILLCAILDNGIFRGFVGFDDCGTNRYWTTEEIDVLTLFSRILSSFLLKERAKAQYLRRSDELMRIFDNQNALVYMIDPDTFELLYLNRKVRELAPGIHTGLPCYQGIMRRSQRCENCPLSNIRQEKNRELILEHGLLGKKAACEASLAIWEGKEAGLIFCRQLPE